VPNSIGRIESLARRSVHTKRDSNSLPGSGDVYPCEVRACVRRVPKYSIETKKEYFLVQDIFDRIKRAGIKFSDLERLAELYGLRQEVLLERLLLEEQCQSSLLLDRLLERLDNAIEEEEGRLRKGQGAVRPLVRVA
jgi:hypothetical protein